MSTKLFAELSILFYNVVIPNDPFKSTSKVLEISLAIVSGVLGLLLIVFIAFHVHRTRNYNREIEALSKTTYDPTLFNKKALPNTNLYSNEKSNPVMMNADLKNVMSLDTKSIISTESDDFADLDNNPIFDISSNVNEKSKNTLVKSDSFA